MAITADRILQGVGRRISNPISQGLLENNDVLAFCDDIVQGEIIPILESAQQDYFVDRVDLPLVSGQSQYDIPYRAVARGLREIKLTSADQHWMRNLPLIDIANAYMYYQWSTIAGFYFLGDKIQLIPDVPNPLSTEQNLAIWYRLPPNQLVELNQVAQVVSIAGDDVVVDGIPGTMVAGVNIDFIQGKSGNSIYSFDDPIDSVDTVTNTITFAADTVPSNLVAGDYICLSGQSYVLNFIPNEAYPLVETLTCMRCLQAVSDFEGMKVLEMAAQRERQNLEKIIEPRIDGESKIVVNYWSIARGYKQNQRSWLYGN